MEEQELNNIISWIINRHCERDDNIHIKRAVKEAKSVIRITELEIDELIDRLTNEVMNSCGKYLDGLDSPFPYVSKVIYSDSLPKVLDTFLQEHINNVED